MISFFFKENNDQPILASIPVSKHVLMCARSLDALPAADRVRALDRFELQDTDVLAALAEAPQC